VLGAIAAVAEVLVEFALMTSRARRRAERSEGEPPVEPPADPESVVDLTVEEAREQAARAKWGPAARVVAAPLVRDTGEDEDEDADEREHERADDDGQEQAPVAVPASSHAVETAAKSNGKKPAVPVKNRAAKDAGRRRGRANPNSGTAR
jgi:hypothetical protein